VTSNHQMHTCNCRSWMQQSSMHQQAILQLTSSGGAAL
jgi:hypothetical protein